jgi:hypothetical protein
MIHFKGSHLEIKKNLNQTKKALLEDNQYKKANQNYLNELNKIYGDNIIDLNVSVSDSLKNKSIILDSNKDDNIIYLQNEIVSNLETTDNDIVINLTEEIKNEADELEPIIELTKGVTSELNEDKVGALVEEEAVEKEAIIDDLIEEKSLEAEIIDQSINNVNQTEEVFDLNNNITNNDNISADTTDTAEVIENNIQDSPSAAINEKFHDEITANKIKIDQLETSISQIEDLSGKVQDIENQNTLLFDKLDDLVNQNLNLSDKLDSDLDLKLDIASVKIDEKSDLKYKALEEKVLNIQSEMLNQTQNLKDNFETLQTQLTNSMSQMSNEKNEILESVNLKMNTVNENSVNAINLLKQELEGIEPKIFKSIEDKQKNKTESEKLQDRFNDITKILDMQNMRMSQLYHSNELQNSQKILQKNMETSNRPVDTVNSLNPDLTNQLVETITQELKNYNDKNFYDIKKQMSNFEKNNWLEKIDPTSLEKKLTQAPERFDNLHDARNFVTNSLSKQTANWIEENQQKIDEISKKLLDN